MGRSWGRQAGLSLVPTASIERPAPETTEAREGPSQHLCSPPGGRGGAETEASEGQPWTDVLGTRAAGTETPPPEPAGTCEAGAGGVVS